MFNKKRLTDEQLKLHLINGCAILAKFRGGHFESKLTHNLFSSSHMPNLGSLKFRYTWVNI